MMDEPGKERQLVPSFLHRVAIAAGTLSQGDPSNRLLDDDLKSASVKNLVELTARNILRAFEPLMLLKDIECLPEITHCDEIPDKGDMNNDDNDDDEDEDIDEDDNSERLRSQVYKYRRSDYARLLFRFMAPVSMQVASQICHDVVVALKAGTNIEWLTQAAFLLFSHWLPVAPHLTPMVTDLLQALHDPWKDLNFSQQPLVFLFVEASYKLCSFFYLRGQIATIQRLWDWTFLFGILQISDTEMNDEIETPVSQYIPKALQWYAARALTSLLDWKPQVSVSVLERLNISDELVPWEPHPWTIEREERNMQLTRFRGVSKLWDSEKFVVPSSEQVGEVLPTPKFLTNVGNGIFFYRRGTITCIRDQKGNSPHPAGEKMERSLIPTATTCKNLALLGAALCQEPHPPPIMLCGPQGAGKSSVLREMLRLCRPGDSLLEFHIDDETDAKTLIGSYSTTDVPGEFAWRPGALTHASREGRWALFEDIDTVPIEIQATIVKLLEDRVLSLGNGKYEKCHPDFRIFATCTTIISESERRSSQRFGSRRGGGRRILNPSLWRKVHVQPLPFLELREVATALFTQIPLSVIDVTLSMMKSLDRSGRNTPRDVADTATSGNANELLSDSQTLGLYTGGRTPSVRDFFKILSRISHGICFEKNVTYATEAQRMVCLTESVEVLVGSCPEWETKQDFVARIAAPAWGISGQLAVAHVGTRCPSTRIAADFVEIGRVQIQFCRHSEFARKQSVTFAQTSHALRLMESIGVCVRQNEPILLVGETGCGKTSLVQQLAGLCERELIVQNLSLQTDSTDLLGGYKPLELKNVARKVYLDFVDLFVSTFSRKQNAKFLEFASSMLEKESWKKLSQCFQRAAKLGTSKMKEKMEEEQYGFSGKNYALAVNWERFKESATKFERQILSSDVGLAFMFSEGALVDAIKNGKWVLLDEINLASSDTLQRLCGLLDDPLGSVTLTERGDASEIPRHPNFRLFAAMNPATDAGKKDLPASIRSRFSELYVDELLDPVELRVVAAKYLESVLPVDGKPPEHKDIIITIVEVYLKCREMADTVLSDGAGHKPRYTLRTLSRALNATQTLVLSQRLPLTRALYEGFQLAFEGALDALSVKAVKKVLKTLLSGDVKSSDLEHPGRRPNIKDGTSYVLVKPFWIKTGPQELQDWSEASADGKSRFILTPSIASSLRRLSRALAAGPWPLLLEGPTSAGKTTLVEYIAARCGHHVVRINNHEHTDVQEYTGSFVADHNGSLSFRDGLLVRALRRGHWVILDELNLAPSEVLEALNRLLDDNRELYLAETNETVKPHPDFRLFATQNPSGAYGGRKPLSRAFRNRFVEVHMGDIPSEEMTTILEKRCGCPRSTATRLVDVMVALRYQRSKKNLFLGKDSFITPRDLLRWAERNSSSRLDFAEQGYMLLAERLRSDEEKEMVQSVLEEHLKVKLNPYEMYYGEKSAARKLLNEVLQDPELSKDPVVASIAPTRSLLRLIRLVMTCMEQKEPVLLVGDTGCGKTTVVQFLSLLHRKKLHAVNCHATTETSDLLGGLRPIRGRDVLQQQIFAKVRLLLRYWPHRAVLKHLDIPETLLLLDHKNSERRDESNETKEVVNKVPDVETMVSIARTVFQSQPESMDDVTNNDNRTKKRRKLTASCSSSDEETVGVGEMESLRSQMEEIEGLARRYNSLFEWSDGPLVTAMKSGQMLLLDEMSLAEDAVLERLNSVLEPSRTLVLAEKGDDGSSEESRVVVAHEDFRVFATMNPGGDFGKRELSPALRSRFTEIWVPAVTDRADYDLVLSRTLDSVNNSASRSLIVRMLDYVDWFNNKICGEVSSPCANYVLSLRDVLSWAKFIDEACNANPDLGMWDAYIHGAALMHLDGLGLGAGLAVEDANTVRTKAESYLAEQMSECSTTLMASKDPTFVVRGGQVFGAEPFYISIGPLHVPKLQFHMAAPTTATNAFRVLRAMQIKKPVLLEGSPGVGKTSLIMALAAASGHKLVRINLSEQTDIADLMGSDLPVQDSSGRGAAFEWSDGVLLRAIKDGCWVLLDELNLASQSVLEGLNSCLDHRATVYIPELGKTFHCPPTFRVFGAQNPLNQGGGRKGLPKSFLNRFTKVYVDALTDADLRTIVRSRYTSFDEVQVDAMIDFNNSIHTEVVERRDYGSEGAPWEFNLRDVFRWCEILKSQASSIQSSARDIYLQRFRNMNDRSRVDLSFQKYFQCSMKALHPPLFQISDSIVQIGESSLSRMGPLHGTHKTPEQSPPQLFLSHLVPMEALARCIALRWPCLVIGSPSSGKTSVIASLAELCNTTLVEQCLSPSSDVTELLGCFEQVEGNEFELAAATKVYEIIDSFFCLGGLKDKVSQHLWNTALKFRQYVSEGGGSDGGLSIRESALEFCNVLIEETKDKHEAEFEPILQNLYSLISEIKQNKDDRSDASHFVWRDGILVEAMLHGHWLVLNNVNLCPSSVLDRLNSVMENDGELLLSECGSLEPTGELSHRVIRPHQNFRVFLTMDPANGEVSRAMRNRCVEIYLPHSVVVESGELSLRQETHVDFLGVLHSSGVRNLDLASVIIRTHTEELKAAIDSAEEICCPRRMVLSTSMAMSMLNRGISGERALLDFLQVGYELEEHRAYQKYAELDILGRCLNWNAPMGAGGPIRQLWGRKACLAQVSWEARVLQLFELQSPVVRAECNTFLSLQHCDPVLAERLGKLGKHSDGPLEINMFDHLLSSIVKLFLTQMKFEDVTVRFHFFDGYQGDFFHCFRWMAGFVEEEWFNFQELKAATQTSDHNSPPNFSSKILFQEYMSCKTLSWTRRRLDQLYFQKKWLAGVPRKDATIRLSNQVTVLEASYLASESIIDPMTLSCPVTPMIFTLFVEIDKFLTLLFRESTRLDPLHDQRLSYIVASFLGERDRLWDILKNTPLLLQPSSFLGFEEAEFLVQWKWLKRALSKFDVDILDKSVLVGSQGMNSLIAHIDKVIFGASGESWSFRAINKKLMRPRVPRESSHWKSLFDLNQIARECSLITEGKLSPFQATSDCIDLTTLVEQIHPLLFVDKGFRTHLLGVLATVHSYWTGEVVTSHEILGNLDLQRTLREMIDGKRNDFKMLVDRSRVDTNISTVENQLSAENLDELRCSSTNSVASSEAYSKLTQTLLTSFAQIQLSPFEEYRCVIEERNIIGNMCRALVNHRNECNIVASLHGMLPILKNFIDAALTCVIWSVSDLRPYQTFLWVLENWTDNYGDSVRLLRSLLPQFLASWTSHMWLNSFNRVGVVATRLELPNLWEDDESTCPQPRSQNLSEIDASFGSIRMQQQVMTEILLHTVGEQFALRRQPQSARFCTIENYEYRLRQYKAINGVITSRQNNDPKSSFWIFLCLALDVVEAIRDGLQCNEIDQLVDLIVQPERLANATLDALKEFQAVFTDQTLRETFLVLILPLLECFQNAWKSEPSSLHYQKNMSMASLYLGLLRFQLSIPQSPLDPGRAPLAKVSLIDNRLRHLRSEIAAKRLYSGFSTGNFSPCPQELEDMVVEGEHLATKRLSQQKKIVTRPTESTPFHELFRLCCDFSQRIASSSVVLDLVNMILNHDDPMVIRRRVGIWVQTSSSFCRRIETDFAGFDDVTMTLHHSIRLIQDGLESLCKHHPNHAKSKENTGVLFQHLLQYPMSNYEETISLAISLLPKVENARQITGEATELHFAMSSASLSRLFLRKMVFGVNQQDFQSCLAVLDFITHAHEVTVTNQEEGQSLDDIQERKFREQFPDHRREFTALFEEKDDTMFDSEMILDEAKQGDEIAVPNLSDSQREWLCLVLRQLFQPKATHPSDLTRTMVFHFGYNAALILERQFECTKYDRQHVESMSGHAFAMMLSMPPKHPCPKVFAHLHRESTILDFQNEPNPAEVMKAKDPLERLMARTTQLLTAFPGHSILLGIGRVCNKVCKFDIMTTPIGKVMTGMEVILRQAQEWEQHASDRVRLGTPLQEVGKLVAMWRKLELESWPQLILARRNRYQKEAAKHLIRLLGILRSSSQKPTICKSHQNNQINSVDGVSCISPTWVWKGVSSSGKSLSMGMEIDCADDLSELTKILDTFILTSPLGQFHERLEILKTCANQQEMEFLLSPAASLWTLQQSRALLSLHSYYSQYDAILAAKIDGMIAPIQTKLRDEVKLAKWDEQTYYALAESTEKNHRKLMKILAELDDCLDLNVGQLLQDEKIKGIRTNVDSTGDVTTSVPSDSVLFPGVDSTKCLGNSCDASVPIVQATSNRIWTNPSNIKTSLGKGILNLEKYAKKMEKLQVSNTDESNWAKIGLSESSYLCGAIFERLSSLRSKSTRPMKERALTDLFRELKRNGFTTTKWAVPIQVRKIEDLFQLPQPTCDHRCLGPALVNDCRRGEMYYQRCLAELNEYRSESMLLGSKHLSKREIDMMLTLGESGMLMISQQRCLLAAVLCETGKLSDFLSVLSLDERRLPLGQRSKCLRLHDFEVSCALALETMRQLSLFMKSSQPLLSNSPQNEWARDTASKIDHCVELLDGCGSFRFDATKILTSKEVQQAQQKQQAVLEVHRIILECRQACDSLECLPVDCFESVVSSLDNVLSQLKSIDTEIVSGVVEGPTHFIETVSAAVDRCLIGFQAFVKNVHENNLEDATLWKCHSELINLWASSEIAKLNCSILEVIEGLKNLHETGSDLTFDERETLVGITADLGILVSHIHAQAMALLETTASFHSQNCKLVYLLLRIFRVLLSKGFCSDETAEDEGSNSGGDVQGMTFEDDQDGTGMGEGDGKRDVTDQLDSEEQLTGLKNDQQDNEKEENKDSRQLNEEEANQGMEMEADFEGEMCDVPDQPQDENQDDAEGEELDREMGNDTNPDEQVVDERMWNDSDDEEEINKEEEKFEKDSGVEGEAIEGATRTKDDNDEQENDKADRDDRGQQACPEDPHEENEPESTGDGHDDINEENEDRYEDQHGVDVKGEERDDDEKSNADEQMQLDDDINLDGEDNPDPKMDEMPEEADDQNQPDSGNEDNDLALPSNPDLEDEINEDSDQFEDAAAPSGAADRMDGDENLEDDEEPKEDETAANVQNQKPSEEEAHGVRASNGTEGILDDRGEDDDDDGAKEDTEGGGDTSGSQGAAQSQSDTNGGSGLAEQDGAVDEAQRSEKEDSRDKIPNPFKNPGDAAKFWHKKLNIVESDENEDSTNENVEKENDVSNETDPTGDFQHTAKDEESRTQVLGEVTEEEATRLDQSEEEKSEKKDTETDLKNEESEKKHNTDIDRTTKRQKRQSTPGQQHEEDQEEESQSDKDDHLDDVPGDQMEEDDQISDNANEEGDDDIAKNRVVSDLSRLKVEGHVQPMEIEGQMIEDEQVTAISSSDVAEARAHWLLIQGETYSLSRRLCEKLRLVMEPLVASKLRGDYRTGKRINMKRVIGYIASGYRKDKIWLKRTKPAKRDYRVLLAVDDSESMKKSGAGEMALRALATLAVGMNQLEIGELGIASFGEDMKLLHPFHLPFSSESGADMVMNFKFDQQRTRTSLCVESAIAALDSMGGQSSMQLVFMVSDGRIERDSRDKLKRLIREMMERNILLAMIIVEGEHKKKDSIVNMKEVTFAKGKPVVKRFIEDYPFPYYIILDDMKALPEVLGDALRQWFEMLSQMQSPR